MVPVSAFSLESDEMPATMVELLRRRAEMQPDDRFLTFLVDGDKEEVHCSYGEMDRAARAIAAFLQHRHAEGKRVLLLFPPGIEFIKAMAGCLYAGAVGVSTYPPDPTRLADTLPSFLNVAKDAQVEFALTSSAILGMVAPLFEMAPDLKAMEWITTDSLESGIESQWHPPDIHPDSIFLLQYTSGSTGDAKGVMMSHANVLSQSASAWEMAGHDSHNVTVSWVPLYHSMGVGAVAQTVMAGGSIVLMSPLAFLQRPVLWLQAISRYRATCSMAPNFAYQLCAQQVTSGEKAALDLSCWKTAMCGGEPVREETLERFQTAFAGCGFRPEALRPGYGLSETCLSGTYGNKDQVPVVRTFQSEALENNRVLEIAGQTEGRRIVGCGSVGFGLKIKIVHPESLVECAADEVGEIWLSGSPVAQGYWDKPQATEAAFKAHLADTGEGPFLRSGDLGFFWEGELFIAGRIKDLIIIRGRNHYPQDIERSVEASHPALQGRAAAAFSVEIAGEEKLVVLQETQLTAPSEVSELLAGMRASILKRHGLSTHAILLLKPGSLPRTRNQKIPRYACKLAFLNGSLNPVDEWRELASAPESTPVPVALVGAPKRAEDIEPWMISRLATRLRVSPAAIDLNQPLSSCGLDSLTSVELALDIERDLGIPVMIQTLLESPSLRELITTFKETWSPDGPQDGKSSKLDLEAEVTLDSEISAAGATFETVRAPNSVFLTGATGFVGAFLLKELLEKTSARVYCLVRARDAAEGRERIRKNLKFFHLWKENKSDRIVPVLGDLSKPLLGLSQETFHSLADTVDSIYHSGAVVNFIYPYRDLKAANVLGTQEVLRLACQIRLKPVHYISTLSVFPLEGLPDGRVIFEDEELVSHRSHLNGYAQSKWVAEKLVTLARSRGVPVTVFRVGEVIGHSRTGICPAQRDAYSLMLKGCIQLGIAPDLKALVHFVPVDFVASAVFHLSGRPASLGQVFHLTHPEPIPFLKLHEFATSLGYSIQLLSYAEWKERVFRLFAEHGSSPLRAFAPLFDLPSVARIAGTEGGLRMDCTHVRAGLAGSEVHEPPPAMELLKSYFTYLQRSGFLEAP